MVKWLLKVIFLFKVLQCFIECAEPTLARKSKGRSQSVDSSAAAAEKRQAKMQQDKKFKGKAQKDGTVPQKRSRSHIKDDSSVMGLLEDNTRPLTDSDCAHYTAKTAKFINCAQLSDSCLHKLVHQVKLAAIEAIAIKCSSYQPLQCSYNPQYLQDPSLSKYLAGYKASNKQVAVLFFGNPSNCSILGTLNQIKFEDLKLVTGACIQNAPLTVLVGMTEIKLRQLSLDAFQHISGPQLSYDQKVKEIIAHNAGLCSKIKGISRFAPFDWQVMLNNGCIVKMPVNNRFSEISPEIISSLPVDYAQHLVPTALAAMSSENVKQLMKHFIKEIDLLPYAKKACLIGLLPSEEVLNISQEIRKAHPFILKYCSTLFSSPFLTPNDDTIRKYANENQGLGTLARHCLYDLISETHISMIQNAASEFFQLECDPSLSKIEKIHILLPLLEALHGIDFALILHFVKLLRVADLSSLLPSLKNGSLMGMFSTGADPTEEECAAAAPFCGEENADAVRLMKLFMVMLKYHFIPITSGMKSCPVPEIRNAANKVFPKGSSFSYGSHRVSNPLYVGQPLGFHLAVGSQPTFFSSPSPASPEGSNGGSPGRDPRKADFNLLFGVVFGLGSFLVLSVISAFLWIIRKQRLKMKNSVGCMESDENGDFGEAVKKSKASSPSSNSASVFGGDNAETGDKNHSATGLSMANTAKMPNSSPSDLDSASTLSSLPPYRRRMSLPSLDNCRGENSPSPGFISSCDSHLVESQSSVLSCHGTKTAGKTFQQYLDQSATSPDNEGSSTIESRPS